MPKQAGLETLWVAVKATAVLTINRLVKIKGVKAYIVCSVDKAMVQQEVYSSDHRPSSSSIWIMLL